MIVEVKVFPYCMRELESRQVRNESGSFASKKPRFGEPESVIFEPLILKVADVGELGAARLAVIALLDQARNPELAHCEKS